MKTNKIIKLLTLFSTFFLFTFLVVVPVFEAHAKVVVQSVEYQDGDTPLAGKLAFDDAVKEKRPGIIVVHEWMGLGSYVTSRIEKLAALGYIAFAADIYGKGIRPTDPKEAGKISGSFKDNRPLLRKRIALAVNEIKKQPFVDPNRLVAMGYCFGGTTVLELARSGANLKGYVSFHGGLSTPTPEDAKNIRGEVLVFTGADDPHVNSNEVAAFVKEMQEGKVKHWELVTYGNAVHAFTNPESGNDPSKGAAYNLEADTKSWEALKIFLSRIFKS